MDWSNAQNVSSLGDKNMPGFFCENYGLLYNVLTNFISHTKSCNLALILGVSWELEKDINFQRKNLKLKWNNTQSKKISDKLP